MTNAYVVPIKNYRWKSKSSMVFSAMLIALVMLYYVNFVSDKTEMKLIEVERPELPAVVSEVKPESVKYILMWTHHHTVPFNEFRPGGLSFDKCPHSNCYITNDRRYLPSVLDWDALLFHNPEYTWDSLNSRVNHHGQPELRGADQEYIFACIESSGNYPVTNPRWDGYFNWTMTYRLDSDVPWPYLAVRDQRGEVVAPAEDVEWFVEENDTSLDINDVIRNKTKAVAWFVSNCNTLSKREKYAERLKDELAKLDMVLDVYGECGSMKCSSNRKSDTEECTNKLESDYYFYLSFENTFSKDYTTEKLLRPMVKGLVPIVWGGSDYSRFAPPNSYINARLHEPDVLAKIIHDLINDRQEYAKYFRWRSSYTFHDPYDSPDTSPFCKLCEALNNSTMRRTKSYGEFRKWWNV